MSTSQHWIGSIAGYNPGMVSQLRFAELLEGHVVKKVKAKMLHEQLTSELLHAIRQLVKETITDVFEKSRFKLDKKSLVWLSDQYFKSLTLNGSSMGDHVIIHEYNLSELPYLDLQLLFNLFGETTFSGPLKEEWHRRTQS